MTEMFSPWLLKPHTTHRAIQERNQKIIERFKSDPNIKLEEIMREYGIKKPTLYRALRTSGIYQGRAKLYNYPKGKTYHAIIKLRAEHPEYTLQELADVYQITRERARQILKGAQLPTKSSLHKHYFCIECGKSIERGRTWDSTRFCSKDCRKAYNFKRKMVTMTCAECGKQFSKRRSEIYSNHGENYFCSKRCQGKYVGKTQGFGVRRDDIRRGLKPSKYLVLVPQAIELAKQGKTLSAIGKALNIPQPAMYNGTVMRRELAPYVRNYHPRCGSIPTMLPQIVELVKQGKNLHRISKELNIGGCSLYPYKEQIMAAANMNG